MCDSVVVVYGSATRGEYDQEPEPTKIDQYVTVTADVGVYTHADDAPTPPDDQTTVDNNPIFVTDGRLFRTRTPAYVST